MARKSARRDRAGKRHVWAQQVRTALRQGDIQVAKEALGVLLGMREANLSQLWRALPREARDLVYGDEALALLLR